MDIFNDAKDSLIIIDSYADKFVLDENIVYHCGTSINHAGSKAFSINILEDALVKKNLIEYVGLLAKKENV